MDFNKKIAEVRADADKSYSAAKDLRKDAAELYSKADRIWAAKVVSDRIRERLLKLGDVVLEPDLINGVISESVESLNGELF